MGLIPEPDGNADLVAQVAQAIGTAQEELWPVHRRHRLHLQPEVIYGRAAAAALAVVRQAFEGLGQPDFPLDDEGWAAYRLSVLRMLGGTK